MSDLISRQAAIDALAKFVPYAIFDESTESYMNGLTDAYNLICQLPSAQSQPHWISCSERLPEKGNEVLVCYDYKGHRFVLTGTLYGDGKFHEYDDEYLTPEGRKYRKAVAWMPLPEPYKAEMESEE
jgi:hypothetical protein